MVNASRRTVIANKIARDDSACAVIAGYQKRWTCLNQLADWTRRPSRTVPLGLLVAEGDAQELGLL